ncbi:MAG: phosphatase PAP2 family protein [Bacteriovoracaceae bacterium]
MNEKNFFYFVFFSFIMEYEYIFAQSVNSNKIGYFSNVSNEFKSPWQPEVRPWLIGGTIATLTILVFEDQIVDPTQKEAKEDRPLGKFNKIGDLGGTFLPNALYSLGMLGSYLISKNELSLKRSGQMLKSSFYSIAISSALKVTIREPRPNKMDRLSFPSGHTTSAFAFSTYIAAEHGLFPYGIAALTLSTFTALSRMTDNYHYLHDVLAGATIGTSYGLGIGYLYKKLDNDKTVSQSFIIKNNVSLMPLYSSDRKELVFLMEF